MEKQEEKAACDRHKSQIHLWGRRKRYCPWVKNVRPKMLSHRLAGASNGLYSNANADPNLTEVRGNVNISPRCWTVTNRDLSGRRTSSYAFGRCCFHKGNRATARQSRTRAGTWFCRSPRGFRRPVGGRGGAASRPDRTAEANISRALLARSRSSLKSNGNPFSAVPEECSNQNIIVNVM
ncbi:unnamed protein product [Gadus morhua 'NCC']